MKVGLVCQCHMQPDFKSKICSVIMMSESRNNNSKKSVSQMNCFTQVLHCIVFWGEGNVYKLYPGRK